jgi:hypothetical protein
VTHSGDPYRILGLGPGASLDDVKRAYRRLAKQWHPDAAGPEAVARFLAIQGAYEALAGPSRRGRTATRPGGRGSTRSSEADPDRAQATREAYRSRRRAWGPQPGAGGRADDPWAWGTRTDRPPRDGGGPAASRAASGAGAGSGQQAAPPGTGEGTRTGEAGAPPGTGEGTRAGEGTRRRGTHGGGTGARRPAARRKATLRSTSYDDAAQEPRHPEWQGSSWYGTSSGTYWTINPREYADPRKHGPEYQARARRAAAESAADLGADADVAAPPSSAATTGSAADGRPGPRAAADHERETATASAAFRHAGAGAERSWSDTGEAASTHEPASAGDRPSSREPMPPPIPASTIGLVAGLVVLVPALVVVLGSLMSGRLWLTSAALVAPLVVGFGVGGAVAVIRLARAGQG